MDGAADEAAARIVAAGDGVSSLNQMQRVVAHTEEAVVGVQVPRSSQVICHVRQRCGSGSSRCCHRGAGEHQPGCVHDLLFTPHVPYLPLHAIPSKRYGGGGTSTSHG